MNKCIITHIIVNICGYMHKYKSMHPCFKIVCVIIFDILNEY